MALAFAAIFARQADGFRRLTMAQSEARNLSAISAAGVS
jgi:hypothetical protein